MFFVSFLHLPIFNGGLSRAGFALATVVVRVWFVSLKRGRLFLAGALLGLGLFRFHIVVPLMLLFVVRKQWKVIRGFHCHSDSGYSCFPFITGWQGAIKYVYLLLR